MNDKGDSYDHSRSRDQTAIVLPRAHTTGTRADGRGGPGAYERSVVQPPARVNALSGPPDFDAGIHPVRRGRLSSYLRFTDDDGERALELYEWNEDVSSAFYRILGSFEVTLRHSMNDCLVKAYGRHWFTDPRVGLDRGAQVAVDKVLHSLGRRRVPFQPLDVSEALTLGFWARLLTRGGSMGRNRPKADYEKTIWRPAVRKAFHHRRHLTRGEVYASVRPLHELRNRVAHYQPIHHLDLAVEHRRILDVTGWMCPEMRVWISQKTQVPRLLQERPEVGLRG